MFQAQTVFSVRVRSAAHSFFDKIKGGTDICMVQWAEVPAVPEGRMAVPAEDRTVPVLAVTVHHRRRRVTVLFPIAAVQRVQSAVWAACCRCSAWLLCSPHC